MRIKTYEVRSMPEALARIKQDLGPDAVILNIRRIKRRRLFGLLGDKLIEVIAGVRDRERTSKTKQPQAPGSPKIVRVSETEHVMESSEATSTDTGMRRLLDDLHDHLNKLGIHRELAQRIVFMLDDIASTQMTQGIELNTQEIRSTFIQRLEQIIPIAGEISLTNGERQVIALVGPTGVGKTTTTAKLAALYSILKRRSVGLISIDAYRIAAYEQLKTYAEIINLPVQLALSPRGAREAVENQTNCELVFIDTVGRSPSHEMHMAELQSYITAMQPDQVYLTLDATTKYMDLLEVYDKYRQTGVSRLLFTKLDETLSLDSLINMAYRTKQPLSYFTTGQSVPDDIEVASHTRLFDFMIHEKHLQAILDQMKE